jgi:hypothetical protein
MAGTSSAARPASSLELSWPRGPDHRLRPSSGTIGDTMVSAITRTDAGRTDKNIYKDYLLRC